MFCLCISQFGVVNKVLLPSVADEWHSVCEKCTYKTIVKKTNLAIAAAPSRNPEKVYFHCHVYIQYSPLPRYALHFGRYSFSGAEVYSKCCHTFQLCYDCKKGAVIKTSSINY